MYKRRGPNAMDSFAHAGGDDADTKLLATSAAPPVSANKLFKGFGYTDEHNKIGRDWLQLEVTQDDGPSREAGTEDSMQPSGHRQDTDDICPYASREAHALHLGTEEKIEETLCPPSWV